MTAPINREEILRELQAEHDGVSAQLADMNWPAGYAMTFEAENLYVELDTLWAQMLRLENEIEQAS